MERRHVELDRGERRLDALASVRPAHSQEVAALEARLGELYQQYLHRWVGGWVGTCMCMCAGGEASDAVAAHM